MTHEEINKLCVIDIIEMPTFSKHCSKIIRELKDFRAAHDNMKRSAYDRLFEKGLMATRDMKELYVEVLRKNLRSFSSTERNFIKAFGDEAFNRTVHELLTIKNNEKNDEKSN